MTINALTDLETLEVSLVPQGANLKRRFPIMKKTTESIKMSDTLKAVLDAPSPEDERFESIAKDAGISDEAALAVKGAMKILSAYSDVISAEDSLSLVSKAFSVELEKTESANKAEDEEEEEKPSSAAEEETEEKPGEEEEEEEETEKSEDAKKEIEKSNLPASVKKEVDRLWKANKELEVVLKQERDERLRKDFVQKASDEFPHVPGVNSDELGLLLKSIHDFDAAIGAKIEGIFKSSSDAVSKGSLFKELGSNRESDESSSFSKLDTIAKSKVSSEVTYSKAFDQALSDNPDLYTNYLTEKEG